MKRVSKKIQEVQGYIKTIDGFKKSPLLGEMKSGACNRWSDNMVSL